MFYLRYLIIKSLIQHNHNLTEKKTPQEQQYENTLTFVSMMS